MCHKNQFENGAIVSGKKRRVRNKQKVERNLPCLKPSFSASKCLWNKLLQKLCF